MTDVRLAAFFLANILSDSLLLFPALWAHFRSSNEAFLMKHFYRLPQFLLFLSKCFTMTLYPTLLSKCRSWFFSFLVVSFLLFHPFCFACCIFFTSPYFPSSFILSWLLDFFFLPLPFSLKSHPTAANSLNVLLREHLWTANGFPSSLA